MRVAFLLLLSLQFCVSGNNDIVFEEFTPETVDIYTYYTNGVNEYTQLRVSISCHIYPSSVDIRVGVRSSITR